MKVYSPYGRNSKTKFLKLLAPIRKVLSQSLTIYLVRSAENILSFFVEGEENFPRKANRNSLRYTPKAGSKHISNAQS